MEFQELLTWFPDIVNKFTSKNDVEDDFDDTDDITD